MNIRLFQQVREPQPAQSLPITFSSDTENTFPSIDSSADAAQETYAVLDPIQNATSPVSAENVPQANGLSLQEIYQRNIPCVVSIACQYEGGSSSGTGVILSDAGYIVTNSHVIENARNIEVLLSDGRKLQASLVGMDAVSDLAVLHVDAEGLIAAELGDSTALRVGDMVVAIGNPLGELASTQTVGYVSGIDREVSTSGSITTISMIQTDAAINPGNSGGPLFNMKGEVVGITTAKYSGTSNSGATIEGISFAVPFDDVRKKVTDLMEYGYLRGPYLGITVSDDESGQGAKVREVSAGYCAEAAGMQAGDVIQSLGGYKVTCMNDLGRALEHFSAGDTIQVQVLRNGKQVILELTLDERPKTTNTDASEPTEPSAPQEESSNPVPQNGSMEDWWNFFFGNGN